MTEITNQVLESTRFEFATKHFDQGAKRATDE